MFNLQAIQDFAGGYLLLLLFVGVPMALYTRLALRHERNLCTRLAERHLRKAVVDYERAGRAAVAIIAFDLEHLERRDVIYRVSGERLFPSEARTLREKLVRRAEREGVPFFLARRMEWNVVVAPANDFARRYVPGETNMPRPAFLALVARIYRDRGVEPPGMECAPTNRHPAPVRDAA